jgi:hypothetical protein
MPIPADKLTELDGSGWELYHLASRRTYARALPS